MKTTIAKEIQRLIESVKKRVHPYLICPKCGRGELQYGYDGTPEWICIWKDCPFRTKEIPSKEKIKYLIELKEDLKKIKEWGI